MGILITSEQLRLRPMASEFPKESLVISSNDAARFGISNEQYCIITVESMLPGEEPTAYAARLSVDSNVTPGVLSINAHFLTTLGILEDEMWNWSITTADNIETASRIVFELVVEQDRVGQEINFLERRRKDFFEDRCFLLPSDADLRKIQLALPGRANLSVRDLSPLPVRRGSTILVINRQTELSMFVPHQKGSVDMVVVIDGSGSMDLQDYLGRDGRPSTRLEGVKKALETLVERRLRSITRVSKIAFVVFGGNSCVFFPRQSSDMTELNHEITTMELLDDIKKINDYSLKRLGVDRSRTNISQAIEYAADMLNYHSYEGNEKTILLLSDGADWQESNEYTSLGEPMPTANDPATLADDLYYVSEIRIHTIAISDEQALARFSPQHRGQVGAVPNPKLLRLIAENSHAHFFSNPDATVLAKLFDELGEGMIYPI